MLGRAASGRGASSQPTAPHRLPPSSRRPDPQLHASAVRLALNSSEYPSTGLPKLPCPIRGSSREDSVYHWPRTKSHLKAEGHVVLRAGLGFQDRPRGRNDQAADRQPRPACTPSSPCPCLELAAHRSFPMTSGKTKEGQVSMATSCVLPAESHPCGHRPRDRDTGSHVGAPPGPPADLCLGPPHLLVISLVPANWPPPQWHWLLPGVTGQGQKVGGGGNARMPRFVPI